MYMSNESWGYYAAVVDKRMAKTDNCICRNGLKTKGIQSPTCWTKIWHRSTVLAYRDADVYNILIILNDLHVS